MSDDDLDALLDEAMDIVDEKDRRQKEESERKKQKLDEDLKKALEEVDGNESTELLQTLQKLMGSASDGNMDESFFNNFKNDVGKLLSSLEGVDDLSGEDLSNLNRVKELMSVLENDDDAKAQELLEKIQKEKPETALPTDKEGFEEAMKEYATNMKNLSETLGAEQQGEGGTPSTIPSDMDLTSAQENMATMLLSTILDPHFVEPIRLMKEAYPPFIEASTDLSEDEKERFVKQYNKTKEICDFLEVPVNKEDDERVAKLLELMHEFSELGEPPENLSDFAPKTEDKTA